MITSLAREKNPSDVSTESFEDFWAFYLSVHQDLQTRQCHTAATLFGMACVLGVYPLTLEGDWLLIGPAVGYSLAWFSHLVFEKKPPAMFSHPLWALMCDFRMVRLFLTDKLDAEWARVRDRVPLPEPQGVRV